MYPHPATTTPLPHIDYRWVFAASLLISAWLIAMDPLINRDAIIYLRAADAYLQSGLAASVDEFGRPILSVCMALMHQWTGIPTLWAGLLLVTLSYGLMCTGFVATVHTLGGDRRVQWLAALVVLSHPMLNHTRSAIMRDPVYWALLVMSLREMLLYLRNPRPMHQLRWVAWVLLAALFRFEGLFFAVFAPLSLLFCKDLPNRLRHCLRLLIPQLLCIAIVGAGIALYLAQQGETLLLFPAVHQYVDKLLALPEEFSAVAATTAEAMLNFTAREDAKIALAAGLASILLLNLCRAITWPWLLVLIWGRVSHLLVRFRRDDNTVLQAHILIGLSYLALFLLLNRFLLERYSNQVVIFLMLYVPFLLSTLWGAGGWRKYLVIALLVVMAGDTLHTGDRDKRFIREATEWVRDNTPAQADIASNEKYIAYFSRRGFNWEAALGYGFKLQAIMENPRHWQGVNYLVVYVRNRDEKAWGAFLQRNGLEELATFEGDKRRRGRVAVVAVSP
mgnify:CR=1 FL=1